MLLLVKKINQKILIGISLLITSKYTFHQFIGRGEGLGNFLSTFPDIDQFLISTVVLFFIIYLLIKILILLYLKCIKLNFIYKVDFYIHLILIASLLFLTTKIFLSIGDYSWTNIIKLFDNNKILKKIFNILPFLIFLQLIYIHERKKKKLP